MLSVTYVSPSCVLFSGRGTRDLYLDLRGRPPVRNVLLRKWVTTPQTARGLVSLAASRGYTLDLNWDELAGGNPVATSTVQRVAQPELSTVVDSSPDDEPEVIQGPDEPLLW